MPTYEIVPETTMLGANVEDGVYKNTNINKCRKLCNDKWECEAFVWEKSVSSDSDSDKVDHGTCTLKLEADSPRSYSANSTVYLKKGNPSYFLIWLALGIFFVMAFFIMCKRQQ